MALASAPPAMTALRADLRGADGAGARLMDEAGFARAVEGA